MKEKGHKITLDNGLVYTITDSAKTEDQQTVYQLLNEETNEKVFAVAVLKDDENFEVLEITDPAVLEILTESFANKNSSEEERN